DVEYFRQKYGVDILEHWHSEWQQHADDGYVVLNPERIELTSDGLLRADGLLPVFFEPEHRGVRYT
ncbi:MAG: coproporphyrinogen III oxidase, partial [Planctomycetales bacterium]|nr:coproporphyrinogen III oxidase [Planctomycetales bacterium]